eukprot:355943-Chlamydomonas_euryale.AAC.18
MPRAASRRNAGTPCHPQRCRYRRRRISASTAINRELVALEALPWAERAWVRAWDPPSVVCAHAYVAGNVCMLTCMHGGSSRQADRVVGRQTGKKGLSVPA